MRVLITAPSLDEAENVSGISTMVRTIINANDPTVHYIHFRIGKKDGERKGLKWLITQFTLFPWLAWTILQHRVQLVHLNTDFTRASLVRDVLLSCFVRYILHRPILLHVHGGVMLMNPPASRTFFHAIIRRILTVSARVVVLSKLEQKQLQLNYTIDSLVLPNAVPPSPMGLVARSFTKKLRFIYLGRIVQSKGIYLIADALKQLKPHYHNFQFVVYGAGPELPKFSQALNDIEGLDFTYRGVARNAGKWQALADADVFLLPSLYGEGLPIAMLEAMQTGCVPVVSDDASIATVVRHSVNGFIVPKGDLTGLVTTLTEILLKQETLERLSQSAKATIVADFGITNYMKQLTAYYRTINETTPVSSSPVLN